MVLFVFFIVDLGAAGMIVAGALALLSAGVYLFYGRSRHTGEFALLHLIERITNRAIAGDHLERELRDIVHEKDEVQLDHVDEVFKQALVLDVHGSPGQGELFLEAGQSLSGRLEIDADTITAMLEERERTSSTAISSFVAVPHLVLDRPGVFALLAIRAPEGIRFTEAFDKVKAIFVLAGSQDRRTLHLQTLAALAQIAMHRRFESEWSAARTAEQLREVLLLGERRRLGRETEG
jgi:mannitol/fructose-specific phosphotransferase system IIA component (Ntr-type)